MKRAESYNQSKPRPRSKQWDDLNEDEKIKLILIQMNTGIQLDDETKRFYGNDLRRS